MNDDNTTLDVFLTGVVTILTLPDGTVRLPPFNIKVNPAGSPKITVLPSNFPIIEANP